MQGLGISDTGFVRPATGVFLGYLLIELPGPTDETLLVTQWTAGASTYEVAAYRVVNGHVRTVLTLRPLVSSEYWILTEMVLRMSW
ncbi:MAG: hypothetical protein DMF56_12755 [Acidobacteria bacterium]|nr:MAG: hypothetical protein DMF56_12755 [Acidobacteriota bacterium]